MESWKRASFPVVRAWGKACLLERCSTPILQHSITYGHVIDRTATILCPSAKTMKRKAAGKCGLSLQSSVDAHLIARLGVDQILDIADDDRLAIVFIAICVCLIDDGPLIVRYLGQNDAPIRDDCDSLIHMLRQGFICPGCPGPAAGTF